MSNYTPIPCAQHERLEFAVLRRIALDVRFRSAHGAWEKILPLDVNTRDGAEWLRVRRSDGSEDEIRLDDIDEFREARPQSL